MIFNLHQLVDSAISLLCLLEKLREETEDCVGKDPVFEPKRYCSCNKQSYLKSPRTPNEHSRARPCPVKHLPSHRLRLWLNMYTPLSEGFPFYKLVENGIGFFVHFFGLWIKVVENFLSSGKMLKEKNVWFLRVVQMCGNRHCGNAAMRQCGNAAMILKQNFINKNFHKKQISDIRLVEWVLRIYSGMRR